MGPRVCLDIFEKGKNSLVPVGIWTPTV